jgi:hypothetical protein
LSFASWGCVLREETLVSSGVECWGRLLLTTCREVRSIHRLSDHGGKKLGTHLCNGSGTGGHY